MRTIIILSLIFVAGCELEKKEHTEIYIESVDGPVVLSVDSISQDVTDAAKKREELK